MVKDWKLKEVEDKRQEMMYQAWLHDKIDKQELIRSFTGTSKKDNEDIIKDANSFINRLNGKEE